VSSCPPDWSWVARTIAEGGIALLGIILTFLVNRLIQRLGITQAQVTNIEQKVEGLTNGSLEQALKEIMDLRPGGKRKTDPPA
jgi:hypothetical protein